MWEGIRGAGGTWFLLSGTVERSERLAAAGWAVLRGSSEDRES